MTYLQVKNIFEDKILDGIKTTTIRKNSVIPGERIIFINEQEEKICYATCKTCKNFSMMDGQIEIDNKLLYEKEKNFLLENEGFDSEKEFEGFIIRIYGYPFIGFIMEFEIEG